MLGGPFVQRQGLGTLHVRIEAAEPEQAGRDAVAGAHRDAARGSILADLDEDGLARGGGGIGHGIVTQVSLLFVWAGTIHQRMPIPVSRAIATLAERTPALYVG